jgi:hypothetical protein
VDVHAVRDYTQTVYNADGSYDPSGLLVGVVADSQLEFDARDVSVFKNPQPDSTAFSSAVVEDTNFPLAGQAGESASIDFVLGQEGMEAFKQYAPFGLTYDSDNVFRYQGKTVRWFADREGSLAFTRRVANDYEKSVDLTALRDANGNLTGMTPAARDAFDQRTAQILAMEMEQEALGISGDTAYQVTVTGDGTAEPGSAAPIGAAEEAGAAPIPTATPVPGEAVVRFVDPGVEEQIRKILGKANGDITLTDMESVTAFVYDSINDPSAIGTITDISDLQYCVNLKEFDVSNQPITSIEPLRNLQYLEIVNLHGCSALRDVSPLGGKEWLWDVWLNGVPVSDVSMILSLPRLSDFNASWGTRITDISALSQSSNLENFYLGQEVEDFSPLLHHAKMRDVHLTGVSREMFAEMIGSWPMLHSLMVAHSPITGEDLYLLKNHYMASIWLEDCPIGDVSALSTQTSLSVLRLMDCQVTDVSPLAALTQIYYDVDLSGNDIADISPLVGMTQLEYLTVPTTAPYTLEELKALLPATEIEISQ